MELIFYIEIIKEYIIPLFLLIALLEIPFVLELINSRLKKIEKTLNIIANNKENEKNSNN